MAGVTAPAFRIGEGFDIHPLAAGRACCLGGVVIPTEDGRGTLGHSDGDPLLHAVCDAILGALALGDIGKWFPDTDPQWHDAASADFLRRILGDSRVAVWRVVNLDCTVFAAAPRLSPHVERIRQRLAGLLDLDDDLSRISVKSKSGNGFLSPDAIAAHVTILLEHR